MTARRLFAPELAAAGEVIELPADSVRHAQVLRLAAGASLVLFDGSLGEADAELIEIDRRGARARVIARHTRDEPAPAVHVVLGLPKGGKLEDIARMLGELGVSSLRPVRTERSVPQLERPAERMARLARVAIEACAQSGQARALVVHPPADLLEAAAHAGASATRLVFWENARSPLAVADPAPATPPGAAPATKEAIHAVVGPEGGLSEREVGALVGLGYRAVGLGPARLRVETAAPVIAGLLLERHGRLR